MNLKQRIELLRDKPVFWSRLGIGYDPPMRDEEGRWLLFSREFDKYRRLHSDFYNIGVKVHSAVIPNGWFAPGEYDYKDVDNVLDAVMDISDDFYFLPRVKVNVPIEWCRQNPEDVFVNSKGPRDKEGIRKLVFSSEHDMRGYGTEVGYTANGGKIKDKRPSVGGVIGVQSFSSEKWLYDAGEALKKLVLYISQKPYANRIIGYHIAYGNCGETTLWGSWDRPCWRHGDYGITAEKNFKKYMVERCGEEKGVPSTELMYGVKDTLRTHFRAGHPECYQNSMFNSDMNVKACNHFCKVVKEVCPDYVAGVFYGYIIGQPNCSHSGHLGIDKILENEYIDFVSAPKGYYKYGPFGPGLEQAPCNSMNRKKLWLDEIDNLTHLHPYTDVPDKAANFDETKTVLVREFSKNLAFDQGYWWMDLGEGCFDSPEVMSLIRKLNEISAEIKRTPTENISEVLLVIDDESMHYVTPSFAYHDSFIRDFASNIKMCGAAVTLIRKKDLFEMPLENFKIVFFLNCFKSSDAFEKLVHEKFEKNTVFVWNYAAGYWKDAPNSLNTKSLTGFEIKDYSGKMPKIPNNEGEIDFPGIYIEDSGNIRAIKYYDNKKIMIAENDDSYGHKNILCALPLLSVDEIYEIIKRSGAKIQGTKNTTVYGNNKFIAYFANEDAEFNLYLPEGDKATEVFENKNYGLGEKIKLKRGSCRFFVVNKW